MTALLEIVAELAAVRRDAEIEFLRAVRRASVEGGYSGTQIARAAGLSKQRVSQILRGAK